MSGKELVSIVVPVYNVENYIDDCLESIVKQTYKNIEILLVDDASPDKSPEICDNWAKRDRRIVVIHKQENEGLNMARETGLSASTGQWISFVDSDDIINTDFVTDLLTTAQSTGVDIVVARNCRFEDKSEIESMSDSVDDTLVVKNKTDVMRYAFVESPDPSVFMIITWCKLFKRSIIEKIDWKLADSRANEDELEAIQYFDIQKEGVAVLKKTLYYYRDNPTSIMNKSYSNNYAGENLTRFEWLEKLYEISTKYFGKDKYADELLYHNIMLNLLFLNKDLSRGTFNDYDYRVFFDNLQSKISRYRKISDKYPLRYEEKRAFDFIKDGGSVFLLWSDDRRTIDDLRRSNTDLLRSYETTQQDNETMRQDNETMRQELSSIKSSRVWKMRNKYRELLKKRR